jgi:hypothetical protein
MKIRVLVALTVILIFQGFCLAQTNQADDWIRVQSDDSEFSIEVPAKYGFFHDTDGFLLTDDSKTYRLKEMNMLNAFYEKTLLSFESYETSNPKTLADIFQKREQKNGQLSEIQRGDIHIKQILFKIENTFAVQQFILSKTHLYILTAASRNGETPALKRFLDSLIFKPADVKTNQTQAVSPKLKIVPFSALIMSSLDVDKNPAPPKKPDNSKSSAPSLPKDENSLSTIIITKPRPSFTEAARNDFETGKIQLRLTFSEEGRITKIGFLKSLRDGLVREAVLAALRIKFLPAEKDGKPQTVSKVLEYSFSIYY